MQSGSRAIGLYTPRRLGVISSAKLALIWTQSDQVDEIWAEALGRRIEHGNLHYLFELPWAYRREVRKACARQTYDVIELNQPHAYLASQDHHRQHGVWRAVA